jgi:Dr1-associated corepressor
MLDFLKEIVQGVPDPSAGGTLQLETNGGEGKKKRKGKKSDPSGAAGESVPKRKYKKKADKAEAETEAKSEPEDHPESMMDLDDNGETHGDSTAAAGVGTRGADDADDE